MRTTLLTEALAVDGVPVQQRQTVPSSVPSLLQTVLESAWSVAVKTSVPPTSRKAVGDELLVPG